MGTVSKAISLLELFTGDRPEIGLSQLAALARFDKATTRRLLVELAAHGLVEQNPATRAYRLGPANLRLARIRETHFPFFQTALPIIQRLAAETGETTHLSEYAAGRLSTVHVEQSTRANRVSVDVGQVLPFHATASGIAFAAFAPAAFAEEAMRAGLERYTIHTPADRTAVAEAFKAARARGYSVSDQGFEEGVFSVAAPILGADGRSIGALAVASPLVRITKSVEAGHGRAVAAAAAEISPRLTGETAPPLRRIS